MTVAMAVVVFFVGRLLDNRGLGGPDLSHGLS